MMLANESKDAQDALDFPSAPSIYCQDQTFCSKEEKTQEDVHNAVCNVFSKYDKGNGERIGFCKSNKGTPKEKFEWHNDGNDHLNGKFSFTFCDGVLCCKGMVNVYKMKNGKCQLEITFSNGDRQTYYKIFDIISRDLMGVGGKEFDVLEGLVCEDFYPPVPDEEADDSDSDEDSSTSDDVDEVRDIVQERMKQWVETRTYEQRRSGMVEMIELLKYYPKIFVDCYIGDKGGEFEKAWCKSYRKESDIALARCQLMFMEQLAIHSTKDLRACMNGQAKNVFAHVFSSWESWSEGGRFGSSWIMEDQIVRTILALRDNGYHPTLSGGRRIPSNYMKKYIEKSGAEHVKSLTSKSVDLRKVVDQEFSEDFQECLQLRGQSGQKKLLPAVLCTEKVVIHI